MFHPLQLQSEKLAAPKSTVELDEYLLVLQKIFQMYVKAAKEISGVEDVGIVAKRLWFLYLEKWNRLGGQMMPDLSGPSEGTSGSYNKTKDNNNNNNDNNNDDNNIINIKNNDNNNDNNDNNNIITAAVSDGDNEAPQHPSHHPVLLTPSRPLLLGLLNLSFRILRSWVTPHDLIRWSYDGIIPYDKAFEYLPKHIQQQISSKSKLHTYILKQVTGKYCATEVSPLNVLFHTLELGNMLQVQVPPLNSALISRSMMTSLGLPTSVVHSHAKLLRYLDATANDSETFQVSTEGIMTSLVIASKLNAQYLYWTTVKCVTAEEKALNSLTSFKEALYNWQIKDANEKIWSLPVTANTSASNMHHNSYEKMTHEELDACLLHMSRTLYKDFHGSGLDGDTGHASFNKVLKRAMRLHPVLALQDSCCSKFPDDVDDSAMCNHSNLKVAFKDGFLAEFRDLVSGQFCNGLTSYISTVGMTNDVMGMVHLQYLAHLERCSRYMAMSPALLNAECEKVDASCVELATDLKTRFGDIRDRSPENESESNSQLQYWRQCLIAAGSLVHCLEHTKKRKDDSTGFERKKEKPRKKRKRKRRERTSDEGGPRVIFVDQQQSI